MIIPLDIKFDIEEAREYYHVIERDYSHLKWIPNNDAVDIEKHKIVGVYGWGIQSNLDDLSKPCPPYHVHKHGSNDYRNTELVFGFAQKLIDFFPECRQLGLAIHPPGVEIGQHVDNDDYFKIHIPLYSTPESYFVFGEEKHVMNPGKMYLVETAFMHGTSNNGTANRVHLLFKLPRPLLEQVRTMTGIV